MEPAGSSPTPMSPQEGDVVIVKGAKNPKSGYLVQQWHHMPQLACASRDAALEFAVSFARRQAVDIWYREAREYTLVERHRTSEPKRV